MSHFTVAVFTKPDGKSVSELLAPYDEGIEVAPYVSRTKAKMIADAKENKERCLQRIKEKPTLRNEDWVKRYLEAETDEQFYQTQVYEDGSYDEEGNELSTYNPNSKWDWYAIGGRWAGFLKATEGGRGETSWCNADKKYGENECDIAQVSKLTLDPTEEAIKRETRFWEVYVEGAPLNDGEEIPDSWIRKEYYKDTYKDKETYVKCATAFTTYAVVTPDGVWHQKGQMGWFGMSSETHEEALDWELHYKERFLDKAEPDWTLTVVDCHI